jgi:hypothetical protein
MSTMVKEKKPFLPQRKAPAGGAVAVVGSPARTTSSANVLAIGAEPRVHLLPTQVIGRKKLRILKRRLGFAVIVVVALVAAAYGAVTVSAAAAQTRLSAAQSQAAQLVAQQGKYGEVLKIKSDVAAIQTAQKTGTAQEILWAPYITAFQNTLPAGTTIVGITAAIDAPFTAPLSTQTVPLVGPHIATVNATVLMPQADISPWLTTLPTLKGFVDATPDSVTSTLTANYTVVVTVHMNGDALSHRFTKAAGTNK